MAKRRKAGRPANEPKTRRGKVKTLPVLFKVPDETTQKARMAYFVALDAIREGRGDDDDAATVGNGVQLGYALREHVALTPEIAATMRDGLAAVRSMYDRHATAGKWGLTGAELQQIRAALLLTDEMIELCRRREIRDAARMINGFNEKGVKIETTSQP